MSVVLVAFVLLLIVYYWKTLVFLYKFYKLDIPPVTTTVPFFGNIFMVWGLSPEAQFRSILTKGRKSERWLKIWFGPMPILGITDPALLQTIYSKEQYMEKPEYFYGTFGVDKSMISTSYAEWKHVRKPFNQSFTKPMLANCISYFVECSTKLNESLAKFTDGSDFDILKYVSICTLDMLMESTYGIEKCQKTKDELYEKIVEAVDEIHTGISARFTNPLIRPMWLFKLTDLYRREMAGRDFALGYQQELYKIRKKIVLEGQQTYDENGNYTSKNSKKFIDTWILNEQQFTPEETRDNVNQLFLGGFETTANEMCHVILMVAMHPEYQELAYQEIKDVFHSPDVEFNWDTLSQLKYTDQVIKETMRHFSVVPFITRTNSIDLELGGQVIPKGTFFLIPIPLVHTNKAYWGPNACSFDPENFSPENVEKRHPYAFMPFSMGKRNCLGYKYAMISMKVMLAKLLLEYKVSTHLKFNELKFLSKISLKLCTPYGIKLSKR